MDTEISFYRGMQVQCPECGTSITAKVWLIIDATEHPDLIERCRQGDIHALACPNGHAGIAKAPLLFRLTRPERILFSPPENTTQEQDDTMKLALVRRLQAALGITSLERLLTQVEQVSRLFLPLVLKGKSDEEVGALKAILQELKQLARSNETPYRISVIRQALGQIYREDSPPLWALLQAELGLAYLDSATGDRAQNLEQAIKAFTAALSVWTQTYYPEAWAETQNNLGEAYRNRILGDRALNIESSIKAYMEALTVRTREGNPRAWAITHNNLGAAYTDRLVGERQENMAKAAHFLTLSLEVLTREKDPEYWAGTQINLGNVYSKSRLGVRAENIEQAIKAFESALTVFTYEDFPQQWALAMNNLGRVQIRHSHGNRALNLELGIQHLEAALTVYTAEEHPHDWAMVQNNLGRAYNHRVLGARSENVEKAIQAFTQCLGVVTREGAPDLWATVLNNLGNAYCDRIKGARASNIELAIEAYENALAVHTREKFPEDWATAQNNLGGAYYQRILDNRATNLERAIEAFEAALTVRVREKLPEDWAETHSNLGVVYFTRIVGERAENVERAISALNRALSVFTHETHPIKWASLQINLGEALHNRLHGSRAKNLESALAAFASALSIFDQQEHPYEWALAQNNLGNVYRVRVHGNREDNLDRAIQAFQDALQVYTHESYPLSWALVQNNLGIAHYNCIHGNRGEHLERAIRAYKAALRVYTRDSSPESWAKVQNNLGGAYADRINGTRAENLRLAVQSFQAALQVYLPERFPLHARLAAANLARSEVEREAWSEAYDALSTALRGGEQLYTSAVTEEGKTVELEENAALYRQVVGICLRLKPPKETEAFLHAEEARSRILRDQLGVLGFPLPANLPAELIAQEQKLLRSDRNLEIALRTAPDEMARQGWVQERIEVRSSLNALWNQLAQEHGATDYVALRRGERLKWEDVYRWLSTQPKQAAILELYMAEHGLIAFVARTGDDQPHAIEINLSRRRLLDISERFFREVHHFTPHHSRDETWRALGPLLLNKVMPYLRDVELVHIIPHGSLHYLPLHALEHKGKPIIDYFAIAYAPSTAVLIRTHSTLMSMPKQTGTLVVGNPTGDLPYAEVEATAVARLLQVHPLLRKAATKARVLEDLISNARAHLATHAHFDPRDPFTSSIVLADGELSARELMSLRLNAEMVVVSACETALQDVRAGDELVGLARAFLYAGGRSLVLSLWRVDDPATAQLMQYFYTHLFDNMGVKKNSTADALRAAMLELRETNPQTYYWAPFVLYGDGR